MNSAVMTAPAIIPTDIFISIVNHATSHIAWRINKFLRFLCLMVSSRIQFLLWSKGFVQSAVNSQSKIFGALGFRQWPIQDSVRWSFRMAEQTFQSRAMPQVNATGTHAWTYGVDIWCERTSICTLHITIGAEFRPSWQARLVTHMQ